MAKKRVPTTKQRAIDRKIEEIIQVNGVTNLVADFKLTHMRVLMAIIKHLQEPIRIKVRTQKYGGKAIDQALPPATLGDFGLTRKLTIPVLEICTGKNNMYYLVKCLDELRRMRCVFPKFKGRTDRSVKVGYMFTGLITHYYIEPYSGKVDLFFLDEMVRRLLLTEEGYGRYNLNQALDFTNKYTVRMYWLICSWRQRSGFVISIENMRRLMSSEDKYLRLDNFMRAVVDKAHAELKAQSNIYFEYRRMERNERQHLCIKVKTVMSQEEKEKKTAQAYDLVYSMMGYLGVSDTVMVSLMNKVDLDDVPAFCRKLADLRDVMAGRTDIYDTDAYVLTAMNSWLEDWAARYEEIED